MNKSWKAHIEVSFQKLLSCIELELLWMLFAEIAKYRKYAIKDVPTKTTIVQQLKKLVKRRIKFCGTSASAPTLGIIDSRYANKAT